MTIEEYRRIALAQPEAVESSHMNHPDFRVRNKIFATISSAKKGQGALKLTPAQQKQFMKEQPAMFSPAAGAWGRRGWTMVRVEKAKKSVVTEAMQLAWRNTATKRMLAALDL